MLVNLTTTNSRADSINNCIIQAALEWHENTNRAWLLTLATGWLVRPSGGWGLSEAPWHTEARGGQPRQWLCKKCRGTGPGLSQNGTKYHQQRYKVSFLRRADEPRKGKCYWEITQDLTLDSFLWRHCLSTISILLANSFLVYKPSFSAQL